MPTFTKRHSDAFGTLPAKGRPIQVRILRSAGELEALGASWTDLADRACDPNIFYEPCMLLPALRLWGQDVDFLCLAFYTENPECTTGPLLLCGLVPLERRARIRGLPCRTIRSLRLPYMMLCTPLIHRDFTAECAAAMLEWLHENPESRSLVEFRFTTGEGRWMQDVHQQLTDRRWTLYQSEHTTRALLKPQENDEAYLALALRGRRRKELRRLEARLAEQGRLEYQALERTQEAQRWIAMFLELELKGWKGRKKTAMASEQSSREFFNASALAAHRRGQLRMLGLFLNGRPVALKCNFISGCGSFAFKIAYDEEFAAFSPGLLLELENIRRFHRDEKLSWMDSTAESQHFMINRLWVDRRSVETLMFSPDKRWGSFMVAVFPLLRWIKMRLRRTSS